jgi:integrase
MSKRVNITKTEVERLPADSILWDTKVSGFGARRQKGDAVSYVLFYRTKDGRQRWQTIGKHGSPWTPDEARKKAREILGEVVAGADPAGEKQADRKAATVADLCAAYLEAATAGRLLTRRKVPKKANTILVDGSNIKNHIVPLLGNLKVASVTRRDIERFQDAVTAGETAAKACGPRGGGLLTGGQGAATRTLGLLGAIFQFAVKRNMRADNPVRGIERHADGRRDRRVTEDEYARLGEALRTMPEAAWPVAVSAAHFLAVTGWRRGEMLNLKWAEIDLASRTARLGDTKTGASMRPLSRAACEILRDLRQLGVLAFPASRGDDQPMAGFHKVWIAIARRAALPVDVTPHVLRHSFASVASDLGYSELSIASMIGHKLGSITSRYTHTADAVLLAAADKVAGHIEERLGFAQPAGSVLSFPRSA